MAQSGYKESLVRELMSGLVRHKHRPSYCHTVPPPRPHAIFQPVRGDRLGLWYTVGFDSHTHTRTPFTLFNLPSFAIPSALRHRHSTS